LLDRFQSLVWRYVTGAFEKHESSLPKGKMNPAAYHGWPLGFSKLLIKLLKIQLITL